MANISKAIKRDRQLFMKIYFMRLKYVKDINAFYKAQEDLKLIKAKWDNGLESPAETLVGIR